MDQEQSVIRFVSIQSLKDLAMLKIVLRLFEATEMKYALKYPSTLDSDDNVKYLDEVKECVRSKLSCMPLPKELIKEMPFFIHHIGMQLFTWNTGAYPFASTSKVCVGDLCLNSEGQVNEAEIVRQVILSRNFEECDAFTALNWATKYCLADCIVMLFERFPKLIDWIPRERCPYILHLMVYWESFINNKQNISTVIKNCDSDNIYDSNGSLNKNMFSYSIKFRNEAAAKYFWPKLTTKEKNENIVTWTCCILIRLDGEPAVYDNTGDANLLFFLLSNMNDRKQQNEVFRRYSECILEQLLYCWPWQKYLVSTIKVLFQYFGEYTYVNIMSYAAIEILYNNYVSELFREVWCVTPSNLKQEFLRDVVLETAAGISLFSNLMIVGDIETMKVVLLDASENCKKEIAFYFLEDDKIIQVFRLGKISQLKLFFKETLSSRSDIDRCKEILLEKCNQYTKEIHEVMNYSS